MTVVKYTGFICFVFVLFMIACTGSVQNHNMEGCDTLNFKYAENIEIIHYDNYSVANLVNPWKREQIMASYVLIDRKDSARITSYPQGTVIYTPVESCVVFTSPHSQLLLWLGVEDCIRGVCDLKYMNIPYINNQVANGRIENCGDGMSPMVEKVIELSPQVILSSSYENKNELPLCRNGIPVIECADYMETSALGRAEWMKFYGMLFGREHEADSLFDVVDSCYTSLKMIAGNLSSSRSVLTERKTGSVWYCPGGRSSAALLMADANGRYVFADDTHSGSLSLSPEHVLDQAADADVWLFIYNNENEISKQSLIREYAGYAGIKAYRNGDVFGCNSMVEPYFEELSFRPDYVLRDLIQIIHPEISLGGLRYYNKVSVR